MGSRIELSG